MTLMDFIRGGPGNSGNRGTTALPGVDVGRMPSEKALADPEPLPKVSGPQYYTYKPAATRAVRTAGFASVSASDATRFLVQAKVFAAPDIAAALEAFYAGNGEPLWVASGDVNDKARGVLNLFEHADQYGLEPSDYMLPAPALTTASVTTPSQSQAPGEIASATDTATTTSVDDKPAAPASPGDEHDRVLMQFELALSAKVLMFAQDMVRGRLDPNGISGYHDFKRKDVNLSAVLPAAKSQDAVAYLQSTVPQGPQFQALKAELDRVLAEAGQESAPIALPEKLLLKPGATSPDMPGIIAAIQHTGSEALKTKHAATLAAYSQSPDYTPELVEVVKSFQSEVGLKPDGVIGAATVRKMIGDRAQDKVGKLVVAMEQARWLPNDLGQRYVFINQPAFTVYYHDQGVEQFSMRVVVGAKAHQTFFFQDEIETVEFNPYWGVPQSIIVNEMLPHLRQDPSYLDRMGYEVAVNGKAVPSSSVNWYGSTQNVSVRQPPSGDNALGDLKILFPNAHAIYMHDTPSKSFFQRDMRALSHGCVRLAEPRKMAAAVLGTTQQDVDARIATGQNAAVKVPVKIPVYVAYFTAWPNKDGRVEYFGDVYGRDAATVKAFETTTKARASHI
ncbi:peptidoglycan-binding protein [Neorhizobium lilium]|uniref:Peptidoglycan-binding protein n=1 Tax=Neorhizobium lilium TaxID=2503024 RepID=A0A3S3S3Z9_9HYPH|nr:L,D-transpeptidase family protein [Neorhizobium lilium]RWX76122.1 peptidoglycan-binding protein [Neorhizobium lilium]